MGRLEPPRAVVQAPFWCGTTYPVEHALDHHSPLAAAPDAGTPCVQGVGDLGQRPDPG
jgi:hypothetical protein